ncbi:MAG: hypothetical protein ACJ8F1_08485 [Polyangia bacterium]
MKALVWSMVVCSLAAWTGACNKSGADVGGVGGGHAGISGSSTGGSTASTGGSGMGGSTAATGGTGGPLGGTGGVVAGMDGGSDGGPVLVPAFVEIARQIADTYLSWGRVDDELRWAPSLCRLPLPGVPRPSQSSDSSTHGQKLYSVFAKNRMAYPAGPQTGQVVVKQSWRAEKVDAGRYEPTSYRGDGGSPTADHFYPYASGDGGVFRTGDFAGLYMMWRVDPPTPDTDQGWVYATILPSGEVTSAGRVSSCMGCHEVATHERLFGVPTGAYGP